MDCHLHIIIDTLPETVVAITGSLGNHYLFKYIDGIRNKVELLPGIDVRGDGGYIVVSPSSHMSGRDYIWELSSRPIKTPIAMPPKWLLDLLLESIEKKYVKAENYWLKIIRGVEVGNRNDAAASLVGHLLRTGIASNVAYEILVMWNDRCSPPQSIDAIKRTFISISKRDISNKRGMRRD